MHILEEIIVWKKSIDLAEELYKMLSKYPTEERYGLISQIQRSVVSISSNIAEGAGRIRIKIFYGFYQLHWVQHMNYNLN